MNKFHEYPQFHQRVYHRLLDSGLDVTLIPRSGFQKTYAILTVNYGSIDNQFEVSRLHQMTKVPDGIAHFLEHKMFEKKDHDAFDLFGKLGADANAFTSYSQTSYLFSATQNVVANLKVLLDFVQSPYFSTEGVAKEQGIIGQEIRMYNDNPDSRLYTGTISNLYPNDPMHIDIAGTQATIKKITPELLMDCYQTFYQPSNMKLVIAGNMDPNELLNTIEEDQEHRNISKEPIRRAGVISDPTAKDVIKESTITLPINRPKAMVGIRGTHTPVDVQQRLRYKLACELMLEMLFDDTADNYLQMYQKGLIDDSFGFSFEMERGFHFATISSDTDRANEFFNQINWILRNADKQLQTMHDEFIPTKRGAIGRAIMGLNAPELIANRYSSNLFGDLTIFDEIAILQSLTMDDIYQAYQLFIRPGAITHFSISTEK